jgi:hypothetical protein
MAVLLFVRHSQACGLDQKAKRGLLGFNPRNPRLKNFKD